MKAERERERESTKTPCLIEEEKKELIGKGLKYLVFQYIIYLHCVVFILFKKGNKRKKYSKRKISGGQERDR